MAGSKYDRHEVARRRFGLQLGTKKRGLIEVATGRPATTASVGASYGGYRRVRSTRDRSQIP